MEQTGCSPHSLGDVSHSLPSSPQESLHCATQRHNGSSTPSLEPSIPISFCLPNKTGACVLDSSKPPANRTSGQQESVKDGNSKLFSRIKYSFTLPLGIFSGQQTRGAKSVEEMANEGDQLAGLVPPKNLPLCPGGGFASPKPTSHCLSDLDKEHEFSYSKIHDGLSLYGSKAPSKASPLPLLGRCPSVIASLSSSNVTEFSSSILGGPVSPISPVSLEPSPMFSDEDEQETPWSPVTIESIHSPMTTPALDRKRQASAGSIRIKEDRGWRCPDGKKGKNPAPPLVS